MDARKYNRDAWNRMAQECNRWTVPVDAAQIAAARSGQPQIVLTPTKVVPDDWLAPLTGTRTLCLASGGGQQGPLLAAAGAEVSVLDNSPEQLARDAEVAQREGLRLELVDGDMRDLNHWPAATFDLIVHPCSNCFVPEVRSVWRECARVLRSGGRLLAGFTNPLRYLFEDERALNGRLEVRYSLPYADEAQLSPQQLQQWVVEPGHPLEFGHTLSDQIGGQLAAGFVLTGFYEDRFDEAEQDPLSECTNSFIATRSEKRD